MDNLTQTGAPFDPAAISRPASALVIYYFIICLAATIAFPIAFIPMLVKYWTLRYTIDEEGVRMSWGFLFRREILLTYRRIQDIHVRRNILHRWLGLAAVSIQTASGTAGAEMTIEGLHEFEELRDYLYSKMRGARSRTAPTRGSGDEALRLLVEIRDALRAAGPTRGADV